MVKGLYSIQLIIVAVILGLILAVTDLPFGWSMLILSITIFGLLSYLIFNALFWTKSIATTEKFLINNQGNSMYKFYYLMANQIDEELDTALAGILKKYKQPFQRALFYTIFALYKKDLDAAKNHVVDIQPGLYKNYYEVSILIEEGKLSEAEQMIGSNLKSWMKSTLRSNIEKKKGNLELARQLAKQAFDETRGINRYVLYKAFSSEELLS